MENAVFWDMALSGSCKNQRFEGALGLALITTEKIPPTFLSFPQPTSPSQGFHSVRFEL
jgi:hypothetical protein